jgi:hypothetical protein
MSSSPHGSAGIAEQISQHFRQFRDSRCPDWEFDDFLMRIMSGPNAPYMRPIKLPPGVVNGFMRL